eukprot:2419854-Amphidinium_carterae.2
MALCSGSSSTTPMIAELACAQSRGNSLPEFGMHSIDCVQFSLSLFSMLLWFHPRLLKACPTALADGGEFDTITHACTLRVHSFFRTRTA